MSNFYGLFCVVVTVGLDVVFSLEKVSFEKYLNHKLSQWRDDVRLQVTESVTEEITTSFGEEIQNLRNGNQIRKANLLDVQRRLLSLEANTVLLRDRILQLHGDQISQTRDSDSGSLSSGFNRSGGLLAVGEHRSGDIWLIDSRTQARWQIHCHKGVIGLEYHPITNTLYAVVVRGGSGILSITVPHGKRKLLMKRSALCIALGLDPRENILFFLEIERRGNKTRIHRLDLIDNILLEPLVTYKSKDKPSDLAVDEVNRHVFVALRRKGLIDQVDYVGHVVRTFDLGTGVHRSTTFTLTVNKLDRKLYFNVGDEIYLAQLEKDEDQKLVCVTQWPRPCGLSIVDGELTLAYMDNSQMDVWTEREGFKKLGDLRIAGKSGSKHICTLN